MDRRSKFLCSMGATRDQLGKFEEDALADIARIAIHGSNGSEEDTCFVKAVFATLAGDILLRLAERET